jgi:hypothetical protein
MVTKNKPSEKKKVKVGKLKLNKDTVKDLTGGEEKRVRGGAAKDKTLIVCPSEFCVTLSCIRC